MNKRIVELAEQAAESSSWKPVLGNEHVQEYFQEFTKLIAAECARLAMTEQYSTSPADYGDMEPYYQGVDDTASVISGKIRRVFGVDE